MNSLLPLGAGIVGLVCGVLASCRLAGRPLALAYRIRPARPRDVLVPILAAVACVLFAVRFGPSLVLPAYLYLAVVAMPLAAIDIEQHRLPDVLTLPSYLVAFGLLGLAAVFEEDGGPHMVMALIGMAALWALYALLYLLSPSSLGWGDVKLAGVLGIYLGRLGADTWVVGTFFGVLIGGLFALGLVASRRASRKSMIPFGPFMIAGALIAVLLSEYRLIL